MHDDLVEEVAQRLRRRGYRVETLVPYNMKGRCGEFDILAYRDGHAEYHEIKTALTPRNEQRAIRQFSRASQVFHNMRFYLHCPGFEKEYFV